MKWSSRIVRMRGSFVSLTVSLVALCVLGMCFVVRICRVIQSSYRWYVMRLSFRGWFVMLITWEFYFGDVVDSVVSEES